VAADSPQAVDPAAHQLAAPVQVDRVQVRVLAGRPEVGRAEVREPAARGVLRPEGRARGRVALDQRPVVLQLQARDLRSVLVQSRGRERVVLARIQELAGWPRMVVRAGRVWTVEVAARAWLVLGPVGRARVVRVVESVVRGPVGLRRVVWRVGLVVGGPMLLDPGRAEALGV
jgi:hypothetical protein